MRKADIYKKGMRDALEPISAQLNNVLDEVHDQREALDDIIDCIDWNLESPEELVKNLKIKKSKRTKLRQFKISIIYRGKENQILANALRKSLNNQKNTCEMIDYSSFINHAGSLVDYRVYVGNPEKFDEKHCRILYMAYGMRILQLDASYVVDFNPKYKFKDGDKEDFILYYESIINKCLERSRAAEKALKSRKKRKANNPVPYDPQTSNKAVELIDRTFNNCIDFWDDKPQWVQIILGLPSIVISFLFSCIAMICMLPVGIGEISLRATVDNLQESNFDSKFVMDAQRQILEVKLTELFKHEQMRDIYDSK